MKTKLVIALVAALAGGAAAWFAQDGCAGGSPVPGSQVRPSERIVVVRDSVSIDSITAHIAARLKPRIRTYIDTLTVERERDAVDSAALAEAHDVIHELNRRLDASETVEGIEFSADTCWSDSTGRSRYGAHMTFRLPEEVFELRLAHEFVRSESVWSWLEEYGPWAAAALGLLTVVIDLIK